MPFHKQIFPSELSPKSWAVCLRKFSWTISRERHQTVFVIANHASCLAFTLASSPYPGSYLLHCIIMFTGLCGEEPEVYLILKILIVKIRKMKPKGIKWLSQGDNPVDILISTTCGLNKHRCLLLLFMQMCSIKQSNNK